LIRWNVQQWTVHYDNTKPAPPPLRVFLCNKLLNMILTHEIFEQGKSLKGGWNSAQLRALGIDGMKQNKGWKHTIIGKEIDDSKVAMFLSLKDAHISEDRRNTLKVKKGMPTGKLSFAPVFNPIPYADQYLHPNWQKMRLFVLNRDKFKCVCCGSTDKTLHAHHIKYLFGKFIWEVPHYYITTLCEDCHSEEHKRDLRASKK